MEKEVSDACLAQLIRAADLQSNDSGSNPSLVGYVSFSTESFQIL